jgi:hypothetical protein
VYKGRACVIGHSGDSERAKAKLMNPKELPAELRFALRKFSR